MNPSESDFDAAADMQARYEEAAKATENIPIVKFGLALERARARRATKTPVHLIGIGAAPVDEIGALLPFDDMLIAKPTDQQLRRDAGPSETAPNKEESKEASSENARSALLTLKLSSGA